MELIRKKKRTKAPKAEPEVESAVAPEPEVVEDETATGGTNVAIAYNKETLESVKVVRKFSRTEEVIDGIATGEIIVDNTFVVGTGDSAVPMNESEFYRAYTPADHSNAKKLRQV